MSESRYSAAYGRGYDLGYGDGVHDERTRARRFDRPFFLLLGMTAGFLACLALRFAGTPF